MPQQTGEESSNPTRRIVLKTISAAGLTTIGATTSAGANGESTSFGSFEDGLEGWKTNGSNELLRVSQEEFSGIVTGSQALAVNTDGDPYPMIENKKQMDDIDLVASPYLNLDVMSVNFNSDSDLIFQFILYYSSEDGEVCRIEERERGRSEVVIGMDQNREENDSNDGNDGVSSQEHFISSDQMQIDQHSKNTLSWDLNGYSEDIRRNAKRFEIRWHPSDYEPSDMPRGNGPAPYDYRGFTIFDGIQVNDTPANIEQTKLSKDLKSLKMERGRITSVTTTERTDNYETGHFNFSDGSSVEYEFERLDQGKYRYTVDGTEYKVGGSWS